MITGSLFAHTRLKKMIDSNPTSTKTKISGGLAGVSGEYFVAAELSRRGFIATITLKNTKGIDILVSNHSATRTLGIQVKTNQGSRKAWVLTAKAEINEADNFFYVFVNLLGNNQLPEFYVVPGKIVATTIRKGHQQWLATPGKNGRMHNDNNMRMFGDPTDTYKGKWELLGLSD
jgi:hypothetical protein